MPANIEFKARIRDFAAASTLAREWSGNPPLVIPQEDVFFRCPNGRLKLRILDRDRGELIHYLRPDQGGPKRSDYTVVPTTAPGALRHTLSAALGETVVVRKTRHLYLLNTTRVHLDRVAGLGEFLEVEVLLNADQSPADGQQIAADLLRRFGIGDDDLIATAYADMLHA